MISLCKCCFLLEKPEHNSRSHSGSIGSCGSEAGASINKIKQDTIVSSNTTSNARVATTNTTNNDVIKTQVANIDDGEEGGDVDEGVERFIDWLAPKRAKGARCAMHVAVRTMMRNVQCILHNAQYKMRNARCRFTSSAECTHTLARAQ